MRVDPLLIPVVLPVLLGFICILFSGRWHQLLKTISIIGTAAVLAMALWLFPRGSLSWSPGQIPVFQLTELNRFIMLACGFFGFLIAVYASSFMAEKPHLKSFYSNLLISLGISCGVVLSAHLLVFLVLWGLLGINLFLLVLAGGEKAAPAAQKTMMIVGASDALMVLAAVILYVRESTFILGEISLPLNSAWNTIAFVLLLVAALAKAGAMPFHTWIPDVAEHAPVPVTAYMPAALDKLLGIYLLARICLDLFVLNVSMQTVLMVIGAVTILAAVMMALVQHDLRRLLAYHAVSQVGYMILGIGTGNPVGIAGGLFHMLNNTIYKSCLFLGGGAVHHRTGTSDLDRLGGLSSLMPFTFSTFLIASLAISGIPPLNGFVSKWMIYQGLIEMGRQGSSLWIVWILAAMFGSAFTLASFMKLIHAIFLGVPSADIQKMKRQPAPFPMTFPMGILALLCIVFGVFAFSVPLKWLILPAVPAFSYLGVWSPGSAALIVVAGGILAGMVFYLFGRLKNMREARSFYGGEQLGTGERVSGTGFYETIRRFGFMGKLYRQAEAKHFDIYHVCLQWSMNFAQWLRRVHTGVLTMYMSWVLLGFLFMAILLLGR